MQTTRGGASSLFLSGGRRASALNAAVTSATKTTTISTSRALIGGLVQGYRRSYSLEPPKKGGIFFGGGRRRDFAEDKEEPLFKGQAQLEYEKLDQRLQDFGLRPDKAAEDAEFFKFRPDNEEIDELIDDDYELSEEDKAELRKTTEGDGLEEGAEQVDSVLRDMYFSNPEPDWYRDFTKARMAEKIDPSKYSAINLPASWYAYQPDKTIPPLDYETRNDMGMEFEDGGYEKVVYVGRHTKVTKGGRIFTMSAMVIDGNGKGSAGWGYGRGEEMGQAVNAARRDLRKNMIHIDRFENRTLAESVSAKFGRSIAHIFAYPWTKRRDVPHSSYLMESVFNAFGLQSVAGKFIGTRNTKSRVKALFKAIQLAEHPQATARRLGVKWFNRDEVWRKGKPRVWTY